MHTSDKQAIAQYPPANAQLAPEQRKRARWTPTPYKSPAMWYHYGIYISMYLWSIYQYGMPFWPLSVQFSSLPATWALCADALGSINYRAATTNISVINIVFLLAPNHSIKPGTLKKPIPSRLKPRQSRRQRTPLRRSTGTSSSKIRI